MRLVAVIASICFSTAAFADPAMHSRALYEVVASGATSFSELLDKSAGAPAQAATGMVEQVRRLVSRADEVWMAAMIDAGPEVFLPYFPCRSAASSLESLAGEFVSFLRGDSGRPDVDLDISYFREDFTRCELALNIAVTFPGVALKLYD